MLNQNHEQDLNKTLELLKPPHYPKDSLFWPPAPAYIILFIILLIIILQLMQKFLHKLKFYYRSSPKKIALGEIQSIEKEIADINKQPLEIIKILYGTAIQKTTLLLKKAAISKYPDSKSLSGDKWLEFLTLNHLDFDKKTGEVITTMVYQEDLDKYSISDLDERTKKLISITKEWITKNL